MPPYCYHLWFTREELNIIIYFYLISPGKISFSENIKVGTIVKTALGEKN